MVRFVHRCFICKCSLEPKECDRHSRSLEHVAAVRKLLLNRREFNRFVSEDVCMDAKTRQVKQRCCNSLSALQLLLRPAEIHVAGSMGKGTSLRGELDMDVVLVKPEIDSGFEAAQLKEALQEVGFTSVRLGKTTPTTAKHEKISLSITVCSAIRPGSWAERAVLSTEFSKKLPDWKKSVVCALSAILRLRFPVPGLLLEAVADSLSESNWDPWFGFLAALRSISVKDKVLAPCSSRPNDLTQDKEIAGKWSEIQEYCKELLQLKSCEPQLSLGGVCQSTQGQMLILRQSDRVPCRHTVVMEFGGHRFVETVRCDECFVARIDKLGLPRSFKMCSESNHLRHVTDYYVKRVRNCSRTSTGLCAEVEVNVPWTDKGARKTVETISASDMDDLMQELQRLSHPDHVMQLHFSMLEPLLDLSSDCPSWEPALDLQLLPLRRYVDGVWTVVVSFSAAPFKCEMPAEESALLRTLDVLHNGTICRKKQVVAGRGSDRQVLGPQSAARRAVQLIYLCLVRTFQGLCTSSVPKLSTFLLWALG